MARVDGEDLASLGGIGRIEIMRTDSETLQTDAEDLALYAVLHVFLVLRKNLVQGVFQKAAVQHVVHGNIFATVVHPYVHYTRIFLSLAHLVSDIAAALCVLDPEVPDALVRVRQ